MILGVIADDMTGASDVALMLAKGGLQVTQVVGQSADYTAFRTSDVVVAALKTRTVAVSDAISQSIDACERLLQIGARQILFKICSTFDSTSEGNIGPVADALRRRLNARAVIVCPAFPANGRTVYQGYLFVGEQLLHESPMKDHPLTPMRDSSLIRLLGAQTRARIDHINFKTVSSGANYVEKALARAESVDVSYLIADAVTDVDLATLAQANKLRPLLVGGSGIAVGLPDLYRHTGLVSGERVRRRPFVSKGRAAIIAGSCSLATRTQIQVAIEAGIPAGKLGGSVFTQRNGIDTILEWALAQPPDKPVLIYSSDDPENVEQARKIIGPNAAEIVENALGTIAQRLVAQGFDRLIVAGGETSGAVVRSISLNAFEIGQEIAPGVPWMYSIGEPRIAVAFKSGNFGGDSFFLTAWETLT